MQTCFTCSKRGKFCDRTCCHFLNRTLSKSTHVRMGERTRRADLLFVCLAVVVVVVVVAVLFFFNRCGCHCLLRHSLLELSRSSSVETTT